MFHAEIFCREASAKGHNFEFQRGSQACKTFHGKCTLLPHFSYAYSNRSADSTDALSTCTPWIPQFVESLAFSKCSISEMQLVGNRWHPNNSIPDLTATLFLGEVVLRIQIGCLASRESERTKSPSLHVYYSKNEEDMDFKLVLLNCNHCSREINFSFFILLLS